MTQAEPVNALYKAICQPAMSAPSTKARHALAVACHQAHADLVARLLEIGKPNRIVYAANGDDLDARAEHIRAVFGCFRDYLAIVAADTAAHAPGVLDLDCIDADAILSDLTGDIAGAITKCAERVREDDSQFDVGA